MVCCCLIIVSKVQTFMPFHGGRAFTAIFLPEGFPLQSLTDYFKDISKKQLIKNIEPDPAQYTRLIS